MKIEDPKFWAKVKIGDMGECWEWQGTKGRKGYGALHRRKMFPDKVIVAHRYAFYLFHGKWPDNFACHHCDNPSCVNPAHLFDGTASDNMRDMWRKGRGKIRDQKGVKNGNARLKEKDIRRIKKLIEKGICNTKIAEKFPVTHSMISRIKLGKAWVNF